MTRNDAARSGSFASASARRSGLFAAALAAALTGLPVGVASAAAEVKPPAESEAEARAVLACAAQEARIGFEGRAEAVFAVELALDAETQRRGMMWREHLAPDAGMLFVFTPPRPSQFWMKNTLIPLDMIFLDVHGRIQHIEREATPGDLTARGPEQIGRAHV